MDKDGSGKTVTISPITAADPHPYFIPGSDPGEGFLNTNAQLFGTTQPKAGAQPANGGFVTNFDYTLGWQQKDPSWAKQILPGTTGADIMKMYTPELLPVLSTLASGYAVSDRWFASAPTETLPNRAFAQMATSQGHLDDHTKRTPRRASIRRSRRPRRRGPSTATTHNPSRAPTSPIWPTRRTRTSASSPTSPRQ